MAQNAGSPVALRGQAMSDWLSNEQLAPLGIAYKRLVLAGRIIPVGSVEHGNEARTLARTAKRAGKILHSILIVLAPLTAFRHSRRCVVFPVILSRARAMRHNTRRDDKQNRPGWWVEEAASPDQGCTLPLDERSRVVIVLFPEPYSARYMA